jgi:hypothetical protein
MEISLSLVKENFLSKEENKCIKSRWEIRLVLGIDIS